MTHAIVIFALAVEAFATPEPPLGPTGLLCEFQRTPALGVRAQPHFSWIVPACKDGSDHQQAAYQIIVSDDKGTQLWDSGKVMGGDSTYVAYAGPALKQASRYSWSVTTWTQGSGGSSCQSEPSAPATMVTALFSGWDTAAKYISAPNASTFAYLRKEVASPAAAVVSALAYVSAPLETPLLASYKVYIDGELIDVGPGRGEAPVWDGDGVFRSLPYATLDVTKLFAPTPPPPKNGTGTTMDSVEQRGGGFAGGQKTAAHTVAIEAMHSGGASAMLQLVLRLTDGTVTTVVTDETWLAFDGDAHRKPGKPQHGGSAGTGFIEYIDARAEPVGWRVAPGGGFAPGAAWAAAKAAAPSAEQLSQLHAKMEPPLQVYSVDTAAIWAAPSPPSPPCFPVACGVVAENQPLLLGCPGSEPIAGIAFAAWGTPKGTCSADPANLTHDPECDDHAKTAALLKAACVGKANCTVTANRATFGDPCYDVVKKLAVRLACPPAPPSPSPSPPPPPPPSSFVADFGKELQGGLVLTVANGSAGTRVHIACGESYDATTSVVGTTWGWEFDWTLRDGAQTLEQHKYMECRWVSLTFSFDGGAAGSRGTVPGSGPGGGSSWAAPAFTLGAWKVHYPWVETDSAFASSNATLDAVWHLARYTVHAASLDAYSDSNTRERRPYEADGVIAATARLLVQRDVLWARHSHAWVLQNPTWPVEWKQISPFLGWQDFMWTGQPDLALAFGDIMHERTMVGFVENSTGLLRTDAMGRHIVDWMPDGRETDETVARHEFTASTHMSVTNAFAARGLRLLASMLRAAGPEHAANATRIDAEAAALTKAMMARMWNGSAFCDGVCAEVGAASLVMSSLFTLAFGLVPAPHAAAVWRGVAAWGLEQIGDYGAFWYQAALAGSYYALDPQDGDGASSSSSSDAVGNAAMSIVGDAAAPVGDDGSALLTALTKCDEDSWCAGLRDDNLTMTRESWHDGTYSHEWGASPIAGVAWGLLGVQQTAPGWATFTVRPKLGGLTHAALTVPTLRGPINVTAAPGALAVHVPCNCAARLCLPRSAHDGGALLTPSTTRLLLDGAEVPAVVRGGHLCASRTLGCGQGGAPRRLSAQPW